MSHFELSEEQEQCIYHARYTLQLVSDLVDAIPDKSGAKHSTEATGHTFSVAVEERSVRLRR